MNAIQAIATAATLQALCDALNAYRPEDHDGRTLEESIDLADLPTFGGDEPADTRGIYSYNDTQITRRSSRHPTATPATGAPGARATWVGCHGDLHKSRGCT